MVVDHEVLFFCSSSSVSVIRIVTFPGVDVDGDALCRPLVELHEDGGERRINDEGDQEEEGEEAEGAEEDEKRGGVEQQLLEKRLLLRLVRHFQKSRLRSLQDVILNGPAAGRRVPRRGGRRSADSSLQNTPKSQIASSLRSPLPFIISFILKFYSSSSLLLIHIRNVLGS